mmetsp:Transcript_33125/g.101132  ORF Transcript_33125/g.101132 Transcript_33125/m.101132 type:complete len:204 (-) Transcript_33125:119-730(-)
MRSTWPRSLAPFRRTRGRRPGRSDGSRPRRGWLAARRPRTGPGWTGGGGSLPCRTAGKQHIRSGLPRRQRRSTPSAIVRQHCALRGGTPFQQRADERAAHSEGEDGEALSSVHSTALAAGKLIRAPRLCEGDAAAVNPPAGAEGLRRPLAGQRLPHDLARLPCRPGARKERKSGGRGGAASNRNPQPLSSLTSVVYLVRAFRA